ncbi:GNAT family protein [Streptomyces sp. NPDC002769]|uniref:GNAT family N-acetyltransferase n=1 Tax=Streptomyces sp. NPDC002769 TaxID=3154542 RepID=UPI00332AA45F
MGEVLLNRATGSIGYIVGAAHRGQRLAVRALRAITEYAHTTGALPRVILEIETDNHPSIAVARSAGFHPSNSVPETVTDKDRTYELLTWEHRRTTGRGQKDKLSLSFNFRPRTVSRTGSLTWGFAGRGGGLRLILCSDQGARDEDEGREGESAACCCPEGKVTFNKDLV